jgi:predicted enzyme related to lactoylglutathione lyase
MKLYMVELHARDWSGTVKWYRDVLGLDVQFVDEPNRFAMFRAGEAHLALKAGTPKDTEHDTINLSFEVGNVDTVRDELTDRGISVSEPFESPFQEGYREARLKDPEGNQLRLFSWLKSKE